MNATDLRCALLRHTAESLHALCGLERSAEWVARRGCGYSPRFTFTTTEVLSRMFAESCRVLADRATAELVDALDDRDGAQRSYALRHARLLIPSPSIAFPDKMVALLRLGRWASSSLDVACPQHDDDTFVATVLHDGALVAWRCGAAIIAGSTGVHGPARLLNRRARAQRKDGTHGGL